ncbi:MAG: hypothetical protein EBU90_29565, partial [Proteobacteria bacterium]|nr:hypothetical protein [Pseudomonadota bacterium]
LEVNNNSLTVTGSLSASGTIFASGGNSNQWNSNYTTTINNSSTWSNTYTLTTQNFIITNPSNWAVNTTTASVTGTLPASPFTGYTVSFMDARKTWNTNNFVLERNGNPIESLAENLICDINGYSFSLTYIDNIVGWKLT